MTSGCLYALAASNDYRQAFVSEFAGEHGFHVLKCLWQGVDGVEPLTVHSETEAYLLKLAGALRVLTSGHASSEIVGDYHRHRRILVHGIKKPGHAGMRKCGIAYYGNSRMLTGICGTLCHSDGSSHVDTGVNGIERSKPAKGVTSYVAEHLGRRELFEGGVECGIHVTVSATLAKCRRTRHHIAANGFFSCIRWL